MNSEKIDEVLDEVRDETVFETGDYNTVATEIAAICAEIATDRQHQILRGRLRLIASKAVAAVAELDMETT